MLIVNNYKLCPKFLFPSLSPFLSVSAYPLILHLSLLPISQLALLTLSSPSSFILSFSISQSFLWPLHLSNFPLSLSSALSLSGTSSPCLCSSPSLSTPFCYSVFPFLFSPSLISFSSVSACTDLEQKLHLNTK